MYLAYTAWRAGVCVISYLFTATCGPKGPWQRLAAALADSSRVLSDRILSQIEMIDPSRAPLSPAPKRGERVSS